MPNGSDKILEYFNMLNKIPRCSGNEAAVRGWLMTWAQRRGYDYRTDASGNLLIQVPATRTFESAPIVVLQGHMDMVCEKGPQSTHDFSKDPIVSHREGDWLKAKDTTLGADNGIAIAYVMALAEDDTADHPPLELLFTVDEETGLNGAKGLSPGFIKGRILINLDSEDEGVATIGCAGGLDSLLTLDLPTSSVPPTARLYRLVVGGLKGGHSGVDINKQRGNANKLIGRILTHMERAAPVRLVSLKGGSRKNAIPRDAEALLAIDSSETDDLFSAVDRFVDTLKAEYDASDSALFVEFAPQESHPVVQGLTRAATRQALDLLAALPDGVASMSSTLEGLVETSSNLATVKLAGGEISILSSQRSALVSRLEAITTSVHAVGRLCGATVEDSDGYPPWQPDINSALLERAKGVYRRLYDRELVVEVIHAGLECAVIGDIYPGSDMISFGPTIRNPHCPDESLHLPSIEKVWDFLKALLREIRA